MLYILGLSGKRGSGKDTYANEIIRQFDGMVYVTSFAEQLKVELESFLLDYGSMKKAGLEPAETLCDMYGLDLEEFQQLEEIILNAEEYPDIDIYKRSNATRQLLQVYGTDIRREKIPNYWVDIVNDKTEYYSRSLSNLEHEPNFLILVTDVRHTNEKELIEYHDGKVVRLLTTENRIVSRDDFIENEELAKHESETALDNELFDLYINTDICGQDGIREAVRNILDIFDMPTRG